ncbi:MAG: hypothetical protein HYZ81_06790 [Nitrospinae bacterium]|nr:hypothetical protein [Nitrospinota bacterium]
MEARAKVLKRVALSGALDALPLDALKLYLLLLAFAREVGSESRIRWQTIQHAFGKDYSREDCQQALTALAAHDLLSWRPASPHATRRQRAQRESEGLEIVFQLNPPHG